MRRNRAREHRHHRTPRARAVAVLAFAALTGVPGVALAQPTPDTVSANRRCLECHARAHLATLSPPERRSMVAPDPDGGAAGDPAGERPGLHIGSQPLAGSPHESLRCTDCHRDSEALPHPARLAPAECGSCHAEPQAAFARSAHGEALDQSHTRAPRCSSCHGAHGVLPPRGREALTHPFNIVRVCGGCHEQHTAPTTNGDGAQVHIQSYLDSVHGRAIVESGLIAAANCADCHGYHDVLHASDPAARTHRENVPDTCGACHLGIVETYDRSVHGQRLAEGDPRAPVCTDCHTAHRITHADQPAFALDIVNECGHCHDTPDMAMGRRVSLYQTYRSSYHGQVNRLGSTRAARCSDCHGAHDILPISDPASRLHGERLIETCRNCHEGAPASLARFDPHADYRDRERYPVLNTVWWYFIIVISAAIGFFGAHAVLWLVRATIERMRVGRPVPGPRPAYAIRRFTLLNRVNHALLIIPFFGLSLTGLPLLFSDHDWALSLAHALGGPIVIGTLHRVFAVVLILNFVLHLAGLIMKARAHRGSLVRDWLVGPNTMLPVRRDFIDCARMMRWFVRGGKRPGFDRWTYWEKFDYLAEIFGTIVIGGSGLLLWFPGFFAKLLPGEIFNIASIVHGYEALLAVGFIFTIHFFNAHLRVEKFPVDDVIFTGQLTEEELRHERPDEYERLVATGQLETLKVEPAPRWQRVGAIAVGVIAMTTGFAIVALIIIAGLQAL